MATWLWLKVINHEFAGTSVHFAVSSHDVNTLPNLCTFLRDDWAPINNSPIVYYFIITGAPRAIPWMIWFDH